jgi:hypothetical protein
MEVPTDLSSKSSISYAFSYDLRKGAAAYPGEELLPLEITKRWPSWEVKKNPQGNYEIFYTKTNKQNLTYLYKTSINVATKESLEI